MSSTTTLLVLMLFMLISSTPLLISADTCHPKDEQALLAIPAHLGRSPYFSSWTSSTSCCSGTWKGVDCTNGRVTGLSIVQANVSGTIPLAISDLPFLHTLVLNQLPNLIGPIPRQINVLTNLSFLTISSTAVSGPIPSDLFFTLSELTQLDLSFNNLYGRIPQSLATLNNLFYIDLSGNQFRGTLPPNFFTKSPQPYLRLANNQLTGQIPAYFGDLEFIEIDLSGNHFVGDASLLFGRSKPTQKIILSGNQFQFDLSKVQFPEAILLTLDLSHNKIYGKIPKQIRQLKNLESLNLSYNNLCGKIPTGGMMTKFSASSYLNNKCLCGTPLAPCK